LFLHHRIVPAVKRVEFLGDMVSYIVLRGYWCNVILLNGHALSEEKVMIQKTVFMRNQKRFFLSFS
jgi:hypothetical protein